MLTYEDLRASLIIPIREENETANALCETLLRNLPWNMEVIFCYDKDSDPTLEILNRLLVIQRPSQFRFVRNVFREGPGGAIASGISEARAQVVVVMMGDLSDDINTVPILVEQVEAGAELAVASRHMVGGSRRGGPPIKTALSRLAGIYFQKIANIGTSDPTNAFKAFRPHVFQQLGVGGRSGFVFGIEFTVRAHRAGLRIVEVPTTWVERSAGRSKFRTLRWLPVYAYWFFVGVASARWRYDGLRIDHTQDNGADVVKYSHGVL